MSTHTSDPIERFAAQRCGGACAIGFEEDDPEEARRVRRRWWGIAIGAVLAGNAMTFGLAISTGESDAFSRRLVHGWLLACTLATAALLGPVLAGGAWRELRRRRVTIELLFLAGLLGAFTASINSVVAGEGPVYFETVIILLVVYALGRQLTTISQRRALRSIEIWRGAPETCEIALPDGATEQRPVASVAVGQAVRVHPGRPVPVDGTVIEGEAFVQESQLTGEFFAARRRVGEAVFAGSHCIDGTLVVRATAPGDARRIDQLARAVRQAQATPSRLVTEADRLVRWFLPAVLAAAMLTFAGWTAADGWRTGLMNAMAVLLVACPCAMGFAAPVSVWSVLGRLAMAGLTPRRGDLVERLAGIDTVVFDKTGTLTEAEATLVDLALADGGDLGDLDEATLRRAIGAVQRASDHPVASAFRAIAARCESGTGNEAALTVQSLRILPGRGVAAQFALGGRILPVVIGTEAVLENDEQRLAWERLKGRLAGLDRGRATVVLIDGRPLAGAVIDERPITSGPETLADLRALGQRLVLMTGDRAERTAGMDLDEVHAGLTPERKRDLVRAMQDQDRRVLFVGDGVNDALAMVQAEVAVAMGGGAPLAGASADAVLIEPDLRRLPWAIGLCRRAVRTIRTNLRIAAGYNAMGIALACAGLLHPVAAAVLMTCSSLIVSWRALRLLEADPARWEAVEENEETREREARLKPATP